MAAKATSVLRPSITGCSCAVPAQFVRSSRSLLLPLKAAEIGLQPAAIGLLVAASFACDSALFPAAGWIMDRFGRRSAGIPSLLGMVRRAESHCTTLHTYDRSRSLPLSRHERRQPRQATGLALLAATRSTAALLAAAVCIGVGNGLSSGLIITLGQAQNTWSLI